MDHIPARLWFLTLTLRNDWGRLVPWVSSANPCRGEAEHGVHLTDGQKNEVVISIPRPSQSRDDSRKLSCLQASKSNCRASSCLIITSGMSPSQTVRPFGELAN
jgi:hypothetical protein